MRISDPCNFIKNKLIFKHQSLVMRILIAPNAFKNSLSAVDAAIAIQKGLADSACVHTSVCFPIGDGGDGTAALIASHHNAKKS